MGIYRITPRAGDVYLVPGDLHFPIQDQPAIDAMVHWFEVTYPSPRRYRRGVILQGDTIDTHSISRFPRKAQRLAAFPRLIDEAATARPFLEWAGEQVLQAVYVPGNHEDWVTDLVDGQPGLSGAPGMDWPNLTGLGDIEGMDFVPYGTWVVLGRKCVVLHGDGLPGKPHLMARKFPDQVTVYGHTHALGSHYTTVYDPDGGAGVRGAINVGHMSRTDGHEYTVKPDWQTGFAVVEFFGERPYFRVQTHQVLKDRQGRCNVA